MLVLWKPCQEVPASIPEGTSRSRSLATRDQVLLGTIFTALFLLDIVVLELSPSRDITSPTKVTDSGKSTGANLADCLTKLEHAKELNILYDLKFQGGRAQAFVGPSWFSLPIEDKQGFHETLQCVLTSGQGGTLTSFEYRHWQSGKMVGETSFSGRFKVLVTEPKGQKTGPL